MLFNCTTKPATICQFSNLHTEISHPCCHLLFAIFLYNSTLFELFFDRKVGRFSQGFAPPQDFNAGIMTDYICIAQKAVPTNQM